MNLTNSETNKLLEKIDKSNEKLTYSFDTCDAKKVILRSKIAEKEKAIKKRAKDIKNIIKLANRLGAIGNKEIYYDLFKIAENSYALNPTVKWCDSNNMTIRFTNYLSYYCPISGFNEYRYKISVYKTGRISYKGGNSINSKTVEGLEERLSVIEEFSEQIDKIILKLTELIEKL